MSFKKKRDCQLSFKKKRDCQRDGSPHQEVRDRRSHNSFWEVMARAPLKCLHHGPRIWLSILTCLLLLTSVAQGAESVSEWTGMPVVTVRSGSLQGYKDKEDTFVFKGIPYAAPPVGEQRWKAPRDVTPWDGVRKAKRFGNWCVQPDPVIKSHIMGDEDCLFLNVWRPQSAERNLPVYVWIHGGGNVVGSANMVPDYYGHALAARSNMVFVSINYRLGPLGWFSSPLLRDGSSPEDDSGNFGTLDIIHALRWIHNNIKAFGGDPGNVTITGESAGGINVLSLLLSPTASGLFHKAMSESGLAFAFPPSFGDPVVENVLVQLLIKEGRANDAAEGKRMASSMSPEEVRAYLRSKPAKQIIKVLPRTVLGLPFTPNVFSDGHVIVERGYDTLADGSYPNKVPLIVGSNKNEVKLFLEVSDDVSWREPLFEGLARYATEMWKFHGVDKVARAISSSPDRPPVFAYWFWWGAPNEAGESPLSARRAKRFGAFHTMEIPFMLGTDTILGRPLSCLFFKRRNRAGREALSQAMMAYLSNFARTGDPGRPSPELPRWEAWSNEPGASRAIVFDVIGPNPAIRMDTTEFTAEGIDKEMREKLNVEERARVRGFLNKFHMLDEETRPAR